MKLTRISSKLGKLGEEDLEFVTSEKAKRFMRRLPDMPVKPLRRQFPGTPPEAIDLLGKMLQVHPRKRINVIEALEHPFLKSLHSREQEHVAHAPFDFSFEDEKLHRVRLQELIWQEIGDFRPTCLPVPQRYHCAQVGDSFVRSYVLINCCISSFYHLLTVQLVLGDIILYLSRIYVYGLVCPV